MQQPYAKILGLPEGLEEPNHYEILALPLFESKVEKIRDHAAKQNSKLLRWQQTSDPALYEIVERLMDEVSAARGTLLDPDAKSSYDAALRLKLGLLAPAVAPEPPRPLAPKPATIPSPPPSSPASGSMRPAPPAPAPGRNPSPAPVTPLPQPFLARFRLSATLSNHNHYEVLGLRPFESNPQTISQALVGRTKQVLDELPKIQSAEDRLLASQFLMRVVEASRVLGNPQEKGTYDQKLRGGPTLSPPRAIGTTTPPATVPGVSPPIVPAVGAGAGLAAARQVAQWNGINVHDVGVTNFANATLARQALQAWQLEFPAVPSAYVPSGRMAPRSLPMLLAGGVLGALIGGIFFWLGVAVTFGMVSLAVLVSRWGMLATGLMGWLLYGGAVFVVFVAAVCNGAMTGVGTVQIGRQGHNRNVGMAVIVSLLSAILSLAPGYVFWSTVAGYVRWGWFTWSLTVAAICLVVLASVTGALQEMRNAKYCEACRRFMNALQPLTLTLGALRVLVVALRQGNLAAASGALRVAPGGAAKAQLHLCPVCNSGYVEVQGTARVHWVENGVSRQETRSARVVSRELQPAEARLFLSPG